MFIKLIGIGVTVFILNQATGVGGEQMTYLMNIVKITLTQHEVNSIVHTVYTDKVISNDGKLPYLSEYEWAEYIKRQMQSKAEGRDTSKDLWITPYVVEEVNLVPGRTGPGFTVRSAGPDKQYQTKDDVLGGRIYN